MRRRRPLIAIDSRGRPLPFEQQNLENRSPSSPPSFSDVDECSFAPEQKRSRHRPRCDCRSRRSARLALCIRKGGGDARRGNAAKCVLRLSTETLVEMLAFHSRIELERSALVCRRFDALVRRFLAAGGPPYHIVDEVVLR